MGVEWHTRKEGHADKGGGHMREGVWVALETACESSEGCKMASRQTPGMRGAEELKGSLMTRGHMTHVT